MPKKQREQPLSREQTREELADHFMRLRLQDAERKAKEYLESLDPRQQ